jgi:putative hemolysin
LGRLPTRPGDVVSIDGWTAEVAGVERRAVTSVRLRPRSAD